MPDSSGRLRILLADDHVVVREGLKLVIEGQRDMIVVSEAGDGASAIQLAQELRPDVDWAVIRGTAVKARGRDRRARAS